MFKIETPNSTALRLCYNVAELAKFIEQHKITEIVPNLETNVIHVPQFAAGRAEALEQSLTDAKKWKFD